MAMSSPDDPILAVSSPPGQSPRGLIRITGQALAPLLDALFDISLTPRALMATNARGLPSPGVNLPMLAIYFQSPRSFTGEDMLELQLPGNPALLQRVCESLIQRMRSVLGAGRYAEAGEFTRRAFTAGRIDLTRAEGIAATIGAVSDAQLEAARLLRTGKLGQWAVDGVEELAHLLALVEAGIDFMDQDDVVAISAADLDAGLATMRDRIDQMLSRSRSWSQLEALPWVVMVGEPNVGKSTLFNALLGHTRAVASEVAGTTRDVLTEPMKLGDGEVMLVDVAGLDEPEGALDHAMQAAARQAIDRAELVLKLYDVDHAPLAIGRDDVPTLHVHTKADLAVSRRDTGDLAVSAVTGDGMDTLREKIAGLMRDRAVTLSGQMMALGPRHRQALTEARDAIDEARALDPADMELVASVMRRALDHLGAVGGQVTPDDVIGRIFATFCIGK